MYLLIYSKFDQVDSEKSVHLAFFGTIYWRIDQKPRKPFFADNKFQSTLEPYQVSEIGFRNRQIFGSWNQLHGSKNRFLEPPIQKPE